jgi:hypothetical protein
MLGYVAHYWSKFFNWNVLLVADIFLIKIYKNTTNKTQTSYQIFNRLKIQYQNIFWTALLIPVLLCRYLHSRFVVPGWSMNSQTVSIFLATVPSVLCFWLLLLNCLFKSIFSRTWTAANTTLVTDHVKVLK